MMEKIQESIKMKHDTEKEAVAHIDAERQRANEEGFEIKKSGYTKKEKKSKGVVIAEWFISDITYKYAEEYVAEE